VPKHNHINGKNWVAWSKNGAGIYMKGKYDVQIDQNGEAKLVITGELDWS